MITLTDPPEDVFRNAIATTADQCVISEGWVKSAWDASHDWIGGSVRSSPFPMRGTNISLALIVAWQWDNGTLKVAVFRG
jgi:hypothetical protein